MRVENSGLIGRDPRQLELAIKSVGVASHACILPVTAVVTHQVVLLFVGNLVGGCRRGVDEVVARFKPLVVEVV